MQIWHIRKEPKRNYLSLICLSTHTHTNININIYLFIDAYSLSDVLSSCLVFHFLGLVIIYYCYYSFIVHGIYDLSMYFETLRISNHIIQQGRWGGTWGVHRNTTSRDTASVLLLPRPTPAITLFKTMFILFGISFL